MRTRVGPRMKGLQNGKGERRKKNQKKKKEERNKEQQEREEKENKKRLWRFLADRNQVEML
jgi:hypothetical protein